MKWKKVAMHMANSSTLFGRFGSHLSAHQQDGLGCCYQLMKEVHETLPLDRTLYHQEGQLYIDAIALTQKLTKSPADIAKDITNLAQKASDCFAVSRTCKMQLRTSELYPWSSDL